MMVKREVAEKPKEDKWARGSKKTEEKIEEIAPPAPLPVNKNVFVPPPPETAAEKKGKWGNVPIPEKKKEEKPVTEVKKGKGKW